MMTIIETITNNIVSLAILQLQYHLHRSRQMRFCFSQLIINGFWLAKIMIRKVGMCHSIKKNEMAHGIMTRKLQIYFLSIILCLNLINIQRDIHKISPKYTQQNVQTITSTRIEGRGWGDNFPEKQNVETKILYHRDWIIVVWLSEKRNNRNWQAKQRCLCVLCVQQTKHEHERFSIRRRKNEFQNHRTIFVLVILCTQVT